MCAFVPRRGPASGIMNVAGLLSEWASEKCEAGSAVSWSSFLVEFVSTLLVIKWPINGLVYRLVFFFSLSCKLH
jgi:hypothetical protein